MLYGGGGAGGSLLEEPGGGGGGFLKDEALEGDLEGGGKPRDFRELAGGDVVLGLPGPPPASARFDCTNRAGGWRNVKPNQSGHEGKRSAYRC